MSNVETSLSQLGHSFGTIYATDSSVVHLGDVHNHVAQTTCLHGRDEVTRFGLCLGSAPQIKREYFVGRASEIDAISQILQPGTPCTEQRRVVLGGMGGAGKTQIAIAYARRYQRSYDSVFWLNATTETSLKASFRLIARTILEVREVERLTDLQVVQRVHQWLSDKRNTQWLLIFDNFDEPDALDLNDYCPFTSHGGIIITSRLADLVSGTELRILSLSSLEESLAILQTRSGRAYTRDDPAAYRLAERFAGLPLALATAGAYLRKSTFSYERYLQEYVKRWNLDERRPLQLQEYRERTLYTTWNQSYARMQNEDAAAACMLRLLAYFDNQNIRFELFSTTDLCRTEGVLPDALFDQVHFESVMRVLSDYGFVETNTDQQSYSLHNCIHDWVLGELNKTIDKQQYWYAFDNVKAHLSTSGLYAYHLGHGQILIPHAVRLTHHRFRSDRMLENIPSDRIMDGATIGIWLLNHHECGAAAYILNNAIEGNEKALERGDHRNVAELGILGAMYMSQGKPDRAELMYTWASQNCKRDQQADRDDYFWTAAKVCYGAYLRADFGKAESMFTLLLKLYDNVFGSDNIQSMVSFGRLIQVYDTAGEHEKASLLSSQVVSKYEKIVRQQANLENVTDYSELLYNGMRNLKKDREVSLAHFLRLVSFLQEVAYRKPGIFICVGRAMLFWQDWANVEQAYRYSYLFDNEAFDSIECDGCNKDLDVGTGLHVCTQCADVDLCDSCIDEYQRGVFTLRKCIGHQFYSVDKSSLAISGSEDVEKSVDLWICQVIDKYSALQANAALPQRITSAHGERFPVSMRQ